MPELSHALQGSIVGLLAEPAQKAAEHSAAADEALPAACLGLGIIRTLDSERGLLYLLTPLPLDQLQRVNTLQVRRCEVVFKLPMLLHWHAQGSCLRSRAFPATGGQVRVASSAAAVVSSTVAVPGCIFAVSGGQRIEDHEKQREFGESRPGCLRQSTLVLKLLDVLIATWHGVAQRSVQASAGTEVWLPCTA